jgi:hypothetical protein
LSFQPAPPRAAELWMIASFASTLWLHWRSRIDACDTLAMAMGVAGPALGPRFAADLRKEAEAAEPDEELPSMATLWAATLWMLSLELPRTRAELWKPEPIRVKAHRIHSSMPVSRVR